jgi:hypothetical protein
MIEIAISESLLLIVIFLGDFRDEARTPSYGYAV